MESLDALGSRMDPLYDFFLSLKEKHFYISLGALYYTRHWWYLISRDHVYISFTSHIEINNEKC